MRSFIRLFCSVALFFVITFNSFAIDSPTNVVIESYTNNSITLAWDKMDDALAYDIYYYDSEWLEDDISTIDLIEENTIVINWLDSGKTYYFRVVAYDDSGETWKFSEELSFDLKWGSDEVKPTNDEPVSKDDFILKTVKLLTYDKISLEFSSDLDPSEEAVREFKISNTEDIFDTFDVIETKLDEENNSILELFLDKELVIWNEYEVVIVAIESETGENIESWIDNSETIFVDNIEENNETTEVELNSAWTENDNTTQNNDVKEKETSVVWTNIEASEIENTTLWAASNQEKLPNTWPEHILMLVLSVILWALIFVFKFKK